MNELPKVGLGTYQLLGHQCHHVVRTALQIGYRHIDTAFAYENHREVAKAIKGIDRESLFLTSKFGVEMTQADSVEAICDRALRELDTEYLDLFLIHWPDRKYPLEAILENLHRMREKGKIRYPGVSNYTIHHLQDAYDAGLDIPFNQVEFHPYLAQPKLLEFCKQNKTVLIAYRPLGMGKLLHEEPLFAKIGKEHGKSASQVILRWIIQKGVPVIPKASSKAHLQENLMMEDFSLSQKEMMQLDELDQNIRYCKRDSDVFKY